VPRLINQQNRPAGEYVTSEVAAPARGQGQATLFRAVLDLAAADLADPTLTIDTTLEGSTDGTTWALFARIEGWQGGVVGRDGQLTPPRLSWMASDNRVLTRLRLRWAQSKTARVGASLDFEAVDVARSAAPGQGG
jgi:hypothetical protein